MTFLILLLGCFFTILSILILSYISVATILGPWIAPTIILFCIGISEILAQIRQKSLSLQDIIKIQAMAAGGGIIATAIGFSIPIIFFLENETFVHWMGHPFYFCGMIGITCLAGGALGLCSARIFSKTLIKKNALPFPVSHLTFQIAATKNRNFEGSPLFYGIASTLGLLILRDGICKWNGLIPKYISILPSVFQNELTISIRPMLWAIGYSTGLETLIPLLVGLLSKYLILYPLNYHSKYLSLGLFQPYSTIQFAFAFCCGILLYEIFHAIPRHSEIIPKIKIFALTAKNRISSITKSIVAHKIKTKPNLPFISKIIMYVEPAIAIVLAFILLSYFQFPILAQIALIIFSVIGTYQICFISGKIGLVQFGRFSTLIALPMYILFHLNFVQVTIVCTFFNICAAVASDLLFDYKTGSFCNIPQVKMHGYQWVGLIVSSLSAGFIFWLLFTYLKIGSPELFAQRAQAKAAIIQTFKFDKFIVVAGFIFAFILKKFKISPAMTFGGILMPNDMTFALITGGLITHLTKHKAHQSEKDFFCAGVFSSESIWVFIKIISKVFV
jgi:hypothetical protein